MRAHELTRRSIDCLIVVRQPLSANSRWGTHMAKNEQTSSKAASKAGKVLSDPKSSAAAKSAAASALTQAKDKPKGGKKK